jgi:hypothetical protein
MKLSASMSIDEVERVTFMHDKVWPIPLFVHNEAEETFSLDIWLQPIQKQLPLTVVVLDIGKHRKLEALADLVILKLAVDTAVEVVRSTGRQAP